MTLNYLELHISFYLAFFPQSSIALRANYVTELKEDPCPLNCLPVTVFHFWP